MTRVYLACLLYGFGGGEGDPMEHARFAFTLVEPVNDRTCGGQTLELTN